MDSELNVSFVVGAPNFTEFDTSTEFYWIETTDINGTTSPQDTEITSTYGTTLWDNITNGANQSNPLFPVHLRKESWVIPLLVLSSINLFAILCFEIYVLYKSYGNRNHQFLGQTLLFGLFLCSLLGYAFVLTPHWVICAITRAGVGFAYVTVFATLVVKCFFLLNLHSGNYLNSAYQSLLLFFALGIQVTIFVQWLVYRPAKLIWSDEDSGLELEVCNSTPLERVEYLSYAMFLLLLAVILSIRARSLKENNREAIYIGVTVGILVIVWAAWMSVFVIFGRKYEDPAQGFGLVCTTIVVFLLVFIPKAVQLSSSAKQHGSSHSMVYSPSFLHLPPHAVLPSSTEGTLVKQQNVATDYCRGFSPGFWRYDYPTFFPMESRTLCQSDRSSQQKSNVSFARTPLY